MDRFDIESLPADDRLRAIERRDWLARFLRGDEMDAQIVSKLESFDGYQDAAAETAVYPGRGEVQGLAYAALGLNGEAGEVAEQVKKALRDDDGFITPERRDALKKELGDVLWYLSEMCSNLGIDLAEVARLNIDKLADRARRGVLSGSGDNR